MIADVPAPVTVMASVAPTPVHAVAPQLHAPQLHAPQLHAPQLHAPQLHAPQLQRPINPLFAPSSRPPSISIIQTLVTGAGQLPPAAAAAVVKAEGGEWGVERQWQGDAAPLHAPPHAPPQPAGMQHLQFVPKGTQLMNEVRRAGQWCRGPWLVNDIGGPRLVNGLGGRGW